MSIISDDMKISDTPEEMLYWLFFCHVESLGNRSMDRLLRHFGSARAVYEAKEKELMEVEGLRKNVVDNIFNLKHITSPEKLLEEMERKDIRFVGRNCDDFPERIRVLPDAPNGLFFRGRLPDSCNPAIAVIGSRGCSEYGKNTAVSLSKELAAAGIDIISGMAAGIDGYAHRGALAGGGDTYAVLGTGPDICYPPSNRDIYRAIPKGGGLISEYPPGTHAVAAHFPRRNRLISALSDGVLVVEAREHSGTWITVDMGLEQGKDIYAVPGRLGDPLSVGCNSIIRQGGRIVTSVQDIIADMSLKYGYIVKRKGSGDYSEKNQKTDEHLTQIEKDIYMLLGEEPVSHDMLSEKLHLSPGELSAGITMLEMRNLCFSPSTGWYIKRRLP